MKHSNLLIVDDSAAVRGLYQSCLEELNVIIDMAENGRDAFNKASINDYDLIITDVDMPEMTGLEFCFELKKISGKAEIPIIMCSTFDSDRDIEIGFKAGVTAYLSKKEVRSYLKSTVIEILWKSVHISQKRILIVEDSIPTQRLLEKVLGKKGFEVITASNGREALECLKSQKPDLILSDIFMPEINGIELCKQIKSDPEYSSIPYIVTSSSEDRTYMQRLIQFGAAAYIVKPFNVNQLIILIERTLSDHFRLILKDRERLEAEGQYLLNSITSLIAALEARDAYTKGHSEAVSMIVSEMIRLTGASETDVKKSAMGGKLHDIGKIGVRDNVLLKPGKLSVEEFDHIKQHPVVGKQILQSITSLADIIPMVNYHHERWDGKGYPEGLSGTGIPFWARVTAVADTFHALVSDRPYRKGMSTEKACAIISDVKGTQLCPESVSLFFKWLKNSKYTLESNIQHFEI